METEPRAGQIFQGAIAPRDLERTVADYVKLYDEADASERLRGAAELSRTYYDLVTDFYEYGWGRSFHFAPGAPDESFEASMRRYEHYLALRLGLGRGQRALDLGCGVGGPMRAIARFSEAAVVGVNNNAYQIQRGRKHNQRFGLADKCSIVEGDFTRVPFDDGTFDAAYVIEAACHAADRRQVFGEAYRALKPGGVFAGYEWCLTSRYDTSSPRHRSIRHDIEKGNGLPDLVSTADVDSMLRDVGFTLVDAFDMADRCAPGHPWYRPLEARATVKGFMHTRAGAWMTHQLVRVLESVRLSARGTVEAHDVLRVAQRALVAGGQTGIFTPMYFFLARKD